MTCRARDEYHFARYPLRAAGLERLRTERTSGGRGDRSALHRLLKQLRPGDVVVVWAWCPWGLLTRHGHQVAGRLLCMWTVSGKPRTPYRPHHLHFLASCGDIPSYALVTVPVVMCSGTKGTVESGKAGPPPHSRRSTGTTCSANRCICSSTSSVLYLLYLLPKILSCFFYQ